MDYLQGQAYIQEHSPLQTYISCVCVCVCVLCGIFKSKSTFDNSSVVFLSKMFQISKGLSSSSSLQLSDNTACHQINVDIVELCNR